MQNKKMIKENQEIALAVAEREMVLSDRFSQSYRSSYPTDFIHAAEMSRKAVVFIKSDANNNKSFSDDQWLHSNSGSGVIVSSDGYIVTNNHVLDGAKKIEVTLNDNRVFIADIVGADPSTDLALLKISSLDLDYLIFGNSDSLQIGEWVMAVGKPFRLQSTVTAGIVSAKARNINLLTNHGIESFIQTDAAVNPGNSGGALINTRGDLVGICTAILSHSGRYEGFSFAVPSNLAKKVINDLKEFGVVQRGWLGIEIENIDNKTAKELGLSEVSGVFISSVSKGGGASDAGLKSIHFDKDAIGALIGRFILMPVFTIVLIVFGAGTLGALPTMEAHTLIVQSAVPALAVLPILVHAANGDVEYATNVVTTSTLLFIIVIPIVNSLLPFIG